MRRGTSPRLPSKEFPMYFKNVHVLAHTIISDILHLTTNATYGHGVTVQFCKFIIKLVKLRKEHTIRETFNAGKKSFHVAIYRMPSGNYEYVSYHCGMELEVA